MSTALPGGTCAFCGEHVPPGKGAREVTRWRRGTKVIGEPVLGRLACEPCAGDLYVGLEPPARRLF